VGVEVSGDVARDVFGALGGVVALLLEFLEVAGGDVAGDVGSVEDGGVEVREAGADLGDGVFEVAEVLEDDAVSADVLGELLVGLAAGKPSRTRKRPRSAVSRPAIMT
jgi:hypothetical protein